jgi:peptide/nickel transport system ATP-binding protein
VILLRVTDLSVSYWRGRERARALREVSFELAKGERLGIVGESGSGKTTLAHALLRVLPEEATVERGSIEFEGQDLAKLGETTLNRIRGRKIGLVFQEPMTAFNPVYTIGAQLSEALRLHRDLSRKAARELAESLFERVRMPDPKANYDAYPHECSGGMRQRALIAIAICNDPMVLIADEPTSALDAMTREHIMALIEELSDERQMAVVLISHSLPVVRRLTSKVLVMHGGHVIEMGSSTQICEEPFHPYSKALLMSLPERARPGFRVRGMRTPRLGLIHKERTIAESGCSYQNLCGSRREICEELPPLREFPDDRHVRCVLHAKELAGAPTLELEEDAFE